MPRKPVRLDNIDQGGPKVIGFWGIPMPIHTTSLEIICQIILDLSLGQHFLFLPYDLDIWPRGSQNTIRLLGDPKTNPHTKFWVDMPSPCCVMVNNCIPTQHSAEGHVRNSMPPLWLHQTALDIYQSPSKPNSSGRPTIPNPPQPSRDQAPTQKSCNVTIFVLYNFLRINKNQRKQICFFAL